MSDRVTEFRGRGPKAGHPVSAAKEQPPDPDHIQPEQLVIVEIVDGIANQNLVHLPAKRFHPAGWGPAFHNYDYPPTTWPSACRQIKGAVYAHGGMLAQARVCPDCEAAA